MLMRVLVWAACVLAVAAGPDAVAVMPVPPSPATLAQRLANGAIVNNITGSIEAPEQNNSTVLGSVGETLDADDDQGLFSVGLDGTNWLATNRSLPADLSGMSGFTVGAWVKPTTDPAKFTHQLGFSAFLSAVNDDGALRSWLDADNVRGWFLSVNADAQFVFGISVPGTNGIVRIRSAAGTAKTNRWAYLSATYSANPSRAALYVNGEKVASKKFSFGALPQKIDYGVEDPRDFPKLEMMHYADRARGVSTPGVLGDVALWDRALLPVELRKVAVSRRHSAAKLFKAAARATDDGPIVYFSFHEGRGETVRDVGPHKMVASARGANAPVWVGDMKVKKAVVVPPAVAFDMDHQEAQATDAASRVAEITQAHRAVEIVHHAEALGIDQKHASIKVGRAAAMVQKAREAVMARAEILDKVNILVRSGKAPKKDLAAAQAAMAAAKKQLDASTNLKAVAEKRREDILRAMNDMQLKGKTEAAGLSVLHGTVEMLGRMIHDNIDPKAVQSELESAVMEVEAETRTAESNRQEDWKDCENVDKTAKSRMAATRKQLATARSRSNMADRALKDAQEQLGLSVEHKSRLRSYLKHVQKQLVRVRALSAVKDGPTVEEKKAEHVMNEMSEALGKVVENEAPFAAKLVPQAGHVRKTQHTVTTDRDWVDTVDWSSFLQTEAHVPWEDVLEKVRWGPPSMAGAGTGRGADGLLRSNPNASMTIEGDEAKKANGSMWANEQLKDMMNETKEKEELAGVKPVDICLTCRNDDDAHLLRGLFNFSTSQPKPEPVFDDMEFDAEAYAKLLAGMKRVGPYDHDKLWLPSKEAAKTTRAAIVDVASAWAGTAAKPPPTHFFSGDLERMDSVASASLRDVEARIPRLELMVATAKAAATRAQTSVDDIERLSAAQLKFYRNYHIRCEAKADIYVFMADKRKKAIAAISKVLALLESTQGDDRMMEKKVINKVLQELEELMRPTKTFTTVAPRPWKVHPAVMKAVVPKECAYSIRTGDSVKSVAFKFGVTIQSLIGANAFLNGLQFPKLGVWIAVPKPAEHGRAYCTWKEEGFASAVKLMEPLSTQGFALPKNASKLTSNEMKVLLADEKESVATEKVKVGEEALVAKEGILEMSRHIASGNLATDEIVSTIVEMPEDPIVAVAKRIAGKIAIMTQMMHEVKHNGSFPEGSVAALLAGNNTLSVNKTIVPESLVSEIRRLHKMTQSTSSVDTSLTMRFAEKVNVDVDIAKKIERGVAMAFGLGLDQVSVSTEEQMRFKETPKTEGMYTASFRLRCESLSVTQMFSVAQRILSGKKAESFIDKSLRQAGVPVITFTTGDVITKRTNPPRRIQMSNGLAAGFKAAITDAAKEAAAAVTDGVKSVTAAVVHAKSSREKLEMAAENAKHDLLDAENKIRTNQLSATSKAAAIVVAAKKEKQSKEHTKVQASLKAALEASHKAMQAADALKEQNRLAERAAAEAKAKAISREEMKLKLREKNARRRAQKREERMRSRMMDLKKLIVLAKMSKKGLAAAAINKKIVALKTSIQNESVEDRKQEGNLGLKILITDAAEKCEEAKAKASEAAIKDCRAAVAKANAAGETTSSKVGLTPDMKRMLQSMPSTSSFFANTIAKKDAARKKERARKAAAEKAVAEKAAAAAMAKMSKEKSAAEAAATKAKALAAKAAKSKTKADLAVAQKAAEKAAEAKAASKAAKAAAAKAEVRKAQAEKAAAEQAAAEKKALNEAKAAVKEAKNKEIEEKAAAKFKTSRAEVTPGFAHFEGQQYIDAGFKGFNALRVKTSSGFTIESWVRVNDVMGDKFSAILSAVGENKFNTVSKKSDGDGPYKKGIVLGYGPSLTDGDRPVWAFGLKGSKGFNPKLSYVRSQSPVKIKAWTHLAASYDGETARLFVNGVLEAVSSSGDQKGPVDFGDSGGHFAAKPKLMLMAYGVNGEVPSTPCCMEADLSDTAVWGKALSNDDISVHAGEKSRTLVAAKGAVDKRDVSVVAFFKFSSRSTSRVYDGDSVRDATHLALNGVVVEGGGAAAPLRIKPTKPTSESPSKLAEEDREETKKALEASAKGKADAALDAVKAAMSQKSTDDAQKALMLEAVIAGTSVDKIKSLASSKSTEGVQSSYRARVIQVVGSSNKFPEARKKSAITALAMVESKREVGTVLEALLAGRKIAMPNMGPTNVEDAKKMVSTLPGDINSLMAKMRESAAREAQAKLSGQTAAAARHAADVLRAQQGMLTQMQGKLNASLAKVAQSERVANDKTKMADQEMKHALELAKDAARTHAKTKKHLELHGFSMPSLDFEKNLTLKAAALAKVKKATMLEEARELAAMGGLRAATRMLAESKNAYNVERLKNAKCFDEISTLSADFAASDYPVEKAKVAKALSDTKAKCGPGSKKMERAIADMAKAKDALARAQLVLRNTKSSLQKDALAQRKADNAMKEAELKSVGALEAEVQKLTTTADMANDKKDAMILAHRLEEARNFAAIANDASEGAKKAARELVALQMKHAHASGDSALFKYKGKTEFDDQPNMKKWALEHMIKYADLQLADAVRNTTNAKSVVANLEAKVRRASGDLASAPTAAARDVLKSNLNYQSMQLQKAQKNMEGKMAAELVARSRVMELSGEFYEFKEPTDGDAKLKATQAELKAARASSTYVLNAQEELKQQLENKDSLIADGVNKITELSSGLVTLTDSSNKANAEIRRAHDELRRTSQPDHQKLFVRATIRLNAKRSLFLDANASYTSEMAKKFEAAVAKVLKLHTNVVHINDVQDVSEEGSPIGARTGLRRRLLGNVRQLAGALDVRFRIVTSAPQDVSMRLDKSMGEHGAMTKALNEIGLEGIPKLMSNEVGSSVGIGGPTAEQVGSVNSPTGSAGITGSEGSRAMR
eukprot:Stramenopile-MAST_4_protein_2405